jgi:hypothetical protein
MSTKPLLAAGAAIAVMAVAAAPAFAQSAPGNNIDSRVRQQLAQPSEREQETALLTGDTDILLTRPVKLFNLHASVDMSATSNAFLASHHARSDGIAQIQIGIGAGTRIGGKVDVFADISVLTARYFKHDQLDYSAVTGLIGARTRLGRLNLTALYQPSVVFTGDLGHRLLTTHRFRLSASLPFSIKRLQVEPVIGGERAIAHPGDYSAWAATAGVTLLLPLSKTAPVYGYATANYERRRFDAYFPDLVGVKRRDDAVSAGIGVVWRPKAWGEVRASYTFQKAYSTSDVNRYLSHSGGLGLSAALKF